MLFSTIIEEIQKNYVDEIDPEILVNYAIKGMMERLDPYSVFLTPEMFGTLKDDTQGGFGGIGMAVDMVNGDLTVISTIEGTPAHRAGMKKGDVITGIDHQSTRRMTLWECIMKMKGPEGSRVHITYIREGVADPLSCQLTRGLVPRESLYSVMVDPAAGFGYIAVTQFRANTAEDMIIALEDLESSETGLSGLIIDLRNNPGGHLDQAVAMSDIFLETGIIVSIKGRHPQYFKVFEAQSNMVKRDYPIVILINGASASASEIVAGALQDHKRAVVLGTSSFGKGSVQTVIPLKDGHGLKYTIARYYTPNNRSIQGRGILPDIEEKDPPDVPWPQKPSGENGTTLHAVDILRQDPFIGRALKILARDKKTDL